MNAPVHLDGSEWIDAAEVARRLSVSRDYVYRHADELGAMRMGRGPKARLRFDPKAVANLFAHTRRPGVTSQRRKSSSVRSTRSVNLLPVRGELP